MAATIDRNARGAFTLEPLQGDVDLADNDTPWVVWPASKRYFTPGSGSSKRACAEVTMYAARERQGRERLAQAQHSRQ
jgi:hypothetical protein